MKKNHSSLFLKHSVVLLLMFLVVFNSHAKFPLEKPDHVTDKQWLGLSSALIEAKILPDVEPGKNFLGSAVAINGPDAAVGIWGDDQRGNNAGAVYTLVEDNEVWQVRHKLILDEGDNDDRFGSSVAISHDHLVVGAWGDDEYGAFAGAVYVYSFYNSNGQHYLNLSSPPVKITASDASSFQRFGFSLDVVEDLLIVGAWGDDTNGVDAGAAYLFDLSNGAVNWSEIDKLTAPIGGSDDRFGYSVAINSDKALIGAYQNNENGANSGAAYLFDFDGFDWNIAGKIDPPDGDSGDHFAFALDMTEDFAVIGSPNDDDIDDNAGSVYIYTVDTGLTLSQKITTLDGALDDQFGSSVSVSGTELMIGSPFSDNVMFTDTGAAYLYSFNGIDWDFVERFVDSTSDANAQFGLAVAIDNNRSLTGSPHQTVLTEADAGSATFHRFDGLAWGSDFEISATLFQNEGQFGQSLVIDGNHAMIGMPEYEEGSQVAGAVLAFEYVDNNWKQTQMILPESIGDGGLFGTAVDIQGDTAVITATYADSEAVNNTGAVFVYEYTTQWHLVEKLIPAGLALNSWVGDAVAISLDKIAVSGIDSEGTNGAVYTFRDTGNSWEELNKLTAEDDVNSNNDFGISLAFDAGDLLVGATKVDGANGIASGAVYVYDFNASTWSQVDKLFVDGISSTTRFGLDISVSNNRLLVGTGSNSVKCYVFEKVFGDWEEVGVITSTTSQAGHLFCSRVVLEGDNALIGDLGSDEIGENQGKLYWYQYDGADWDLISEFHAADGQAEDEFSTQVALNDNRVMIGAPYQDERGIDLGAVYTYNLDVIFVDGFNQPE